MAGHGLGSGGAVMFVLTSRRARQAVLAAVLAAGLATAAAWAAGAAAPPARAQAAAPVSSGGGCYTFDNTWVCVYSGGTGGRTGSPESSAYTCTYTPASETILQQIGAGPPDPGYRWDLMVCPGPLTGPGALVEVNTKTGAPAISPADLVKIAIGDLTVPTMSPGTAPPRGKDGLVGLPEWFWVPAGQWHRVSVTITAGPVWATAVASPTRISYLPGGGGGGVSCTGPGVAYDPRLAASRQHTDCSYTYAEPSAGQPGFAYQAAVVVTWTISWSGSGGAGGVITTGYATGTVFGVRVAQAEALVTSP
jgi:hypothetical protein